jgi:hypothetical protein
MASSGMFRRVALVRTDVSEELVNSCHPDDEGFFETSVLRRAIWRAIPEDAILHSHRR